VVGSVASTVGGQRGGVGEVSDGRRLNQIRNQTGRQDDVTRSRADHASNMLPVAA
jgi:hypothetical protein